MKTIKQNGSESNPKNSQLNINIQIIDSRINEHLNSIKEKTNEYWETMEERFEQMKDEVMCSLTDRIEEILDEICPLEIMDEVDEEELENYIDENYNGMVDQLSDLVWDNL
ncbi:hypothetical protein [Maribellus mangrovi]|uniref:hypothetical protein n=1 Tax=Maribellus mangrovi TaxID=3133146 RepID=UPI0030ED1DAD